MRVLLFVQEVPKKINDIIAIKENDYIIAVDGAFDELLKQKIKIDLVIGDIDSITNLKKLKDYEQIKLNPKKDVSDTKFAVEEAYKLSNNVIIVGGIRGRRIEHFISNLYLLKEYNNLIILDDNSKIHLLKEGSHLINKGKYINVFALPKANLTMKGFEYDLNNYELNTYDSLILSNEVKASYGEITVHNGQAIIIETKKGL